MTNHIGKCACGNIEFSFEGEPINSAFCYCHECQKHTGSDKWFGLWVPFEQFSFTKGNPSTFTRLGDSAKPLNHYFCGNCGTTLSIEVTVAGFYSVSATALVTDNTYSPQLAIYTASAPKWAVFPEGVPQFEKLPTDLG